MIAVAIATMLIAMATGIFVRGSRIGDNTADSTRINTMATAFREFLLADLRAASPSASRAHEDGRQCAYVAKGSVWVSYCNTDAGVYRAEVPRGGATPPQVAADQPLHPHGAPRAGGASSSLVASGSTLNIRRDGPAFTAELETPHPDPTIPPARVTLRITPRVGG